MKKNTLTAIAVLITTTLFAQLSASVGLNSRLHGVAIMGYELEPINGINAELNLRANTEQLTPTIGLQAGFISSNSCNNNSLRLSVGAFYHTGKLLVYKTDNRPRIMIGGSFRAVVNRSITQLSYDGQTIQLTVGFLFKKRE